MRCCAIWCIGAVSSALLRRDETGDTFAGPSECWLETGVAFARVGRASTETAIAFAGEKWVFLVRFSVALVMVVSAGAVQGRAVVMAVSCWPTSVPAEVSLVSTLPSGRVLCTKKFTLLGLMVGASAKKFALQAQNGRKTLFSGALGEFFAEGPVEEPCWASFVAPTGIAPGLVGSAPSLPAMVGVLHYTKPSHSVSPACRTLMSCNSPRCSVPHAVLCAHRVSLVC